MSTTTTTYSKYRKRKVRRKDDKERKASGPNMSFRFKDHHTDSGKENQKDNKKWSSNKVKKEMSSFIAEFAYLTPPSTSTNTTPKEQNANSAKQDVQVYAMGGEVITPFVEPDPVKRVVDWEDQKGGTIVYNVEDPCCSINPSRRPVRSLSRKSRKPSGVRHLNLRRQKVSVKKSRSRRRSTSRDLSCPSRTRSQRRVIRRQFSGWRASKSRSHRGRPRSCRSTTPLTPMRRRVRSQTRRRSRSRTPSCSPSHIRHIPMHFRQRKTREVIVKKSKPKLIYKTIEPCSEPTLVTLYPRPPPPRPPRPRVRRAPTRRRLRRYCSRPEPELPCKCDMCRNKYRSLTRLYGDPCFNPCAPPCPPCPPVCNPCPPVCAPRPPICSPCPPRQIMPRDCSPCSPNWRFKTGYVSCSRPWATPRPCCADDCCQPQLASRCVKSVCFNYGSTGLTHFFHSILDSSRACCY